ncbi:2-succinyl-5-enolpyruvyl-6-hydroxy-3-cyclohexene-1-carboxylic-acid synthase [Afifella sp. YEN Y35]|uniref:2-succinyl-5-enolpyruvyl-6-hydroxy-3- cyclohexene-1-carboxylic-acid synthase n=1 Tax=Afifella sp. YEN Y35 TaxID=3388337 RepID=UPI0039E0DC2B
MNGPAEQTFHWAAALASGLAAAGVRRLVASPGSRSTPLTLAALRHPEIGVRMVVDERSAAFFALGLAKASGEPVALAATSGSAIANWLPAVVEADMARVPLILLSSDRPPELQDCGANQTMEQAGLFSTHVRKFFQLPPAEAETGWLANFVARMVAASRGPLPGPVHINVPLREPLVPSASIGLEETAGAPIPLTLPAHLQPTDETLKRISGIIGKGRGAIVCGSEALSAAARRSILDLARRLDAPVFADVLSGLRFGTQEPEILAHPDQVARSAPMPDWILRFGGTPVSKAVSTWMEKAHTKPQIVVSETPRLADPAGTASHVVTADVALVCAGLDAPAGPPEWRADIVALDSEAMRAADAVCDGDRVFEGALMRRLVRAVPPSTAIFLGNSLAVRAADWLAGRSSTKLRVYGNRGVSGIDGNLSTAFGISAISENCVAVVGDLAFLHDLGALALGRDLPLAILLLDNGGGGIFDHLAQADLPEFETGWLTPQSLDHVAAARAFGLAAQDVDGLDEAMAAVNAALDRPGTTVIRATIVREKSLARFKTFFAAAAAPVTQGQTR